MNITTPCGNPLTMRMLYAMTGQQVLADTFRAGHNAYLTGEPEAANPYRGMATDPFGEPRLYREWKRGYRNARKRDRFNATIRNRQATK